LVRFVGDLKVASWTNKPLFNPLTGDQAIGGAELMHISTALIVGNRSVSARESKSSTRAKALKILYVVQLVAQREKINDHCTTPKIKLIYFQR